jgi:hypothetical protein
MLDCNTSLLANLIILLIFKLQDKVEMSIQPLQIAIVAKQSKIVQIIIDTCTAMQAEPSALKALKAKTDVKFRQAAHVQHFFYVLFLTKQLIIISKNQINTSKIKKNL